MPSLDTILPSSSPRAFNKIYDLYKFKDEDAATQYIEAVTNAYNNQWRNKYVTNDATSVDAIQQTLQRYMLSTGQMALDSCLSEDVSLQRKQYWIEQMKM